MNEYGKSSQLTPCNRGRILVADDEEMIRTVFKEVLAFGMPDLQVDFASNGQEALDYFLATRQALVLMDVKMPVMDGETAFYKIRDACAAQSIEMPSVLFCTGYDPSKRISQLVEEDPTHGVLRKPVSPTELIDALTALG